MIFVEVLSKLNIFCTIIFVRENLEYPLNVILINFLFDKNIKNFVYNIQG